jgi:hypothetical protein
MAITAVLLFAGCYNCSAQGATVPAAKPLPFVSTIFGDNMVLQRGNVNTIGGSSEPGDHVRVHIGKRTASAVAGADCRTRAYSSTGYMPPVSHGKHGPSMAANLARHPWQPLLPVKPESGGGLLFSRPVTPLPRRNMVHFCAGV